MAVAVITRDGDAAYAAALAALGLETVVMPVTQTAPAADPDALGRAIARGGYRAVVVASARAARELVRAAGSAALRERASGATLPELSAGGAALPEVWAVGAATARALGDVPAIVPDGVRDGASLARAMIAMRALAGERVLVPRAEDGRDDAIAILRDAGAIVDDVVVYRTVPVPADDPAIARGRELLAAGGAAVCVVFAPSQVAALDALVGVSTIVTTWVAIGETTAQALRDRGAAAVAVAATPTPEGIANAVAAVYPPRS